MFEKKPESSLSVAVTSATMYFSYFDVVSYRKGSSAKMTQYASKLNLYYLWFSNCNELKQLSLLLKTHSSISIIYGSWWF